MTANDLKDLDDRELMLRLWDAIEKQEGYYIALVKNEMNRRVRWA